MSRNETDSQHISVDWSSSSIGVFSLLDRAPTDILLAKTNKFCKETGSTFLGRLSEANISDATLILTIGGDRELLALSRLLINDISVLVVPIRSGELGFLTEWDTRDDFSPIFNSLLENEIEIFQRSRIIANNTYTALNELVLVPREVGSSLRYSVNVTTGGLDFEDTADGLAISTPTGSTGWALSMGGTIIDSRASVIEVIPNNSINHSIRPLILSDTNIISVNLFDPAILIIDNLERIPVQKLVEITRSSPINIVRPKTRYSSVSDKLEQKIDYSRLGTADLTISARWILQIVNENEGISQGEICELTGISRRTVQTSLQLLIDHGLLVKGGDPTLRNGRRVGYYRGRQKAV